MLDAVGSAPVPTVTPDPVLERLDDQIHWYGSKADANRRWYLGLKILSLVAAAAIPVLSVASISTILLAALGALILAIEGLQQLMQFHQGWLTFRSTAEDLKHEKYLYGATAGPYQQSKYPHALLAERVEVRISTETRRWEHREEGTRAETRGS